MALQIITADQRLAEKKPELTMLRVDQMAVVRLAAD